MLRLLILRHMKSGWALPGQRDFERQLNDRGEADLAIVRDWISQHSLTPGQVFCSSATRTKQTLEGISPAFESEPEIQFVDAMYSGFIDEYLECLKTRGTSETILMIGHNPTCASLANAMVGSGDPEEMDTLTYKFPTGAMVVIEFSDSAWSDIQEGNGKLTHFLMPKPFRRH